MNTSMPLQVWETAYRHNRIRWREWYWAVMESRIDDQVWNVLRTCEGSCYFGVFTIHGEGRGWRAEDWGSFTPSSGFIRLTNFEHINHGLEYRLIYPFVSFYPSLTCLYPNAISFPFEDLNRY